ncbi:MAG: tRNA pseudouridine(38-40) synthase TruA [Deltaproteobacteria bacterium]|nr:tRNA pseudouridine(38-40) synthase TruA [Deltaproteobacteria bacterium]MBW2393086.1 tRNA pseudouridine(38-40) synthase TruA [Deltaproteobacteria bacterium]
MPTFRLTLEYDGTDFEGWQRQPEGHRSVQAELEGALTAIVGAPATVKAAGRTDAGVHAEGQLVAAALATDLAPDTLARALNAKLPADMAVSGAAFAPDGWNPRFAATGKLYRYQIWNAACRSPLRLRRWHHVPQRLDLPAMQAASECLRGRHDFASFQAAGSSVSETTRSLARLDVTGEAGAAVLIEAEGDGFLRHMVRNLVGTLLEVGVGRQAPSWTVDVLAARDRRAAGPTAPALGLTLVRVDA